MKQRIVLLVFLLVALGVVLLPRGDSGTSEGLPAASGTPDSVRGTGQGGSGDSGRITWASWREEQKPAAPTEVRDGRDETVGEAPSAARSKIEKDLGGMDVVIGGRTAASPEASGDEKQRARN